jgi:hypothetical protein
MLVPEAAVDILLDCYAMFSFLDGDQIEQANDDITQDAEQGKHVVKEADFKEKHENAVNAVK